jgi:membrane-associated phospholipid phosphatase
MFRTDLNHWLQSFSSDAMTAFMEFISWLGLVYPLMIIALFILSAVHFRKGLVVLNIMAITAVLTGFFKETIDYPRPIAVDASLMQFEDPKTREDLSALQPEGFFGLFGDEILDKIRSSEIGRFGLPSGHTSLQVALWISAALLLNVRWLWILSTSMVVLTMLSRMYLGLHYLGDVLGGLALGLLVIAIWIRLAALSGYLRYQFLEKRALVFLLSPLVILAFSGPETTWQIGLAVGANLAIFLSTKDRYFLELSDSWIDRILFFIVLTVVFLAHFIGLAYLTRDFPAWADVFIMFFAGFAALWISCKIALSKNWLTPPPAYER